MTNKTPEENREDELRRIVEEARDDAQEVKSEAREIVTHAQFIEDLAGVTLTFIPFMNPTSDWENRIAMWGEQRDELREAKRRIVEAHAITSTGTASGLGSDSTTYFDEVYITQLPKNSQVVVIEANQDLIRVLERGEIVGKILELLNDLELDTAPEGSKHPSSFLEEAYAAYEGPVTDEIPATSSLIPMRQCVMRILTELLRRRPNQEAARSHRAKVLSIGMQLKKDVIGPERVENWANTWNNIQDNDLSDSKDAILTREEWRRRFYKAAYFLHGFLSGLD